MSRSGYSDDGDGLNLYRGNVANAIRGKRGQAFLRDLARAMDAMPVKELIADNLIDADGNCCAIGVVCKQQNIDVSDIDYNSPHDVGDAVNIAWQLAAEIEYENDEASRWDETRQMRWQRMREWVNRQLTAEGQEK